MQREPSIVIELQRLATEKGHDITDLLRKALLVATKLNLNDFRAWIDQELHGYRGVDIPAYRKCRAEVRLRNPYHGLIPVVFRDSEWADIFCNVEVRDSIESLVHLLGDPKSESGILVIPLSPEQQKFLLENQDSGLELPPVRTVGRNQIASIVDGVRTTILEWALKLESQGILGKNLSFSDDEKRKAASSTEIRIGNFQGILGNVEHSTLTQNLQMTVHKGDFSSLRRYLNSLGLENADVDELEQAIRSDPAPTQPGNFGQRVSQWIGKMVGKAAAGMWNVAIGAAGNLLALAISSYYGL